LATLRRKKYSKVACAAGTISRGLSRLFVRANFKSPVPTTVIVFKSESSYRPFKPMQNVAGYFQSGPDVNYITLSTESASSEQSSFTIIFHEYTHLLIDATSGNVPTWVNEGLAEYYSTFSISDDQKVSWAALFPATSTCCVSTGGFLAYSLPGRSSVAGIQ
jgi:hypothetical protein